MATLSLSAKAQVSAPAAKPPVWDPKAFTVEVYGGQRAFAQQGWLFNAVTKEPIRAAPEFPREQPKLAPGVSGRTPPNTKGTVINVGRASAYAKASIPQKVIEAERENARAEAAEELAE